jgi:hypothetical protein
MKNTLLLLVLIAAIGALHPTQVLAQSVAINADSSAPDPSAILDLKSTVKGFLTPRMTQAQRNIIALPAIGLLIYQTDNTPGFYYYDGAAWTPSKTSGGGSGSSGGSDTLWSVNGNDITNTNTGNVGIAVKAGLTLKNKLTIGDPGGFNGNDIAFGNGTQVTGIAQTPTVLQVGSNTDMSFLPGYGTGKGHFGIGVTGAPKNKLQIGDMGLTDYSGNDFAIGNGTSAMSMAQDNTGFRIYSTTDIAIVPGDGLGFGNVGINVPRPVNKLQIGNMGISGFTGNDFAIGNGRDGTAITQYQGVFQVASSTDITFLPQANTYNGRVGINVATPLNRLQIGSVGSSGFVGNDLAIGNGAQATGINQYPTLFQIASNTDIAILPQANTNSGRVGINTSTPKAPLHVAGSISQDYFHVYGYGFDVDEDYYTNLPASIVADHCVEAQQFDVPSDVRVKNIVGISNTAKDLKILEAIRITDYTMKDSLQYRNKPYKKVIAQEVEKVYPQVISRHPGFIPNVYQPTDSIRRTTAGTLLHFPASHHLTADAKKLQAVPEGQSTLQEYTIVSMPSPTEVVIADPAIVTKKMFVYGQEVPDFRKVDYDGLFTLNISATQELSKEVKDLKRELAVANANIRKLTKLLYKRTAIHPINQ